MPYLEVRKAFSEALRQQLQTQGPATNKSIQQTRQSRKYAHSPISAAARA
jgi:hypothetical protein